LDNRRGDQEVKPFNSALPLSMLAFVAAFALLPAGVAAQEGQTFKKGLFTDDQLGFKIKPPTKWRQIPTQPDEQWIVGLFQSDREFSSRAGWSRKLIMRIIMFDKNIAKKKEDSGKKDDAVITIKSFNRNLRYRDYRDYVKQTQGGGGFFFSVEKERKGSGAPAMIYEVKFEKLASAKRRLVAWEFKRKNVSFAVEFDIYEEHYKKLKSKMTRVFKSFKFIESAGESPVKSSGDITIPNLANWKKLDVTARHERRIAMEDHQHAKLRAKLPKDWKVTKTKHFLIISHADAKFTKKIISLGDACWGYLEKRFGKLSDEYVRRSIIRICKDYDEYQAYHSSSGSWFTISFGADVDEMQFYDGELIRDQWGYMMGNLFNHYIADKDSELLDDAPYWLRNGIRGYIRSCQVKGKRVDFPPSIEERMAMSRLINAGGFKKDKLQNPRQIMNLTHNRAQDLYKAKLYPDTQCVNFVRFLEGPGRKNKLVGGRDYLVDYCRAANKAGLEYEKRNPDKSGGRYKEAKTEEEEEEQAASREKRSKKMSKESEARSRDVLKLLNESMCKWTEGEWKKLAKAYARTCKK
jgi:hypothetical protein